uniref:Glycosyltransferase N-terminal domain-containing protein n=1 Tax=Oryza meridionalis TaxID=40149 RepID=A0A0E0DBW9_9ORYZ
MSTPKKHVFLFPFTSKGHIAGFLSLASRLHRILPHATITLVSTPRNVAALRAAAAAPFLDFHALRFDPAEHGLPPGGESQDEIFPPLLIPLYEAFETLQPAFDDFVASTAAAAARVVVISDVFVAWTVEVARRHGCGHAFFASCGAFGSAVTHSLFTHLPLRPEEPSGRVFLPEYPDLVIHRSQVPKYMLYQYGLPAAGAANDGSGGRADRRFLDRQLAHGNNTDAVLVNAVAEPEPAGLAMLRRTLRVLPVWPIGPLSRDRRDAATEPTDDTVLRWMDTQPPGSVLYISFGTNSMIRPEHMLELAAALESSGRCFLWKIKPPEGDVAGLNGSATTPSSYNRWLAHCGWSSVLESMAHGVPVIGWPLTAEQFHNVMVLEGLGVCVEVARGNTDETVVERRRVAEVVKMVMGETAKADDMRRRVQEVRTMMVDAWKEGGSSFEASQAFLEAMKLK